jgi:preprotein translocase subunit SecF
MFYFLKYKKFYFLFSGIFLIGAIFSLIFFGLNLGIEFTGGSILEIEYLKERPSEKEIEEKIKKIPSAKELGQMILQPAGEKGVIIRIQGVGEKIHQEILASLDKEKFKEHRFESIGPVIGKELSKKAILLVILSVLAILFYIAIAFRQLSWPRRPFEYGLIALITLSHDLLITLGIVSILGYFFNLLFTIPILVALLTIAGYSVNDTVVIFDRIRENLIKRKGPDFQQTLNISLNQVWIRSLNTSLTTLFVLLAILFFGGTTLHYFALTLIIGILIGTYSSIFLATPLLLVLPKIKR